MAFPEKKVFNPKEEFESFNIFGEQIDFTKTPVAPLPPLGTFGLIEKPINELVLVESDKASNFIELILGDTTKFIADPVADAAEFVSAVEPFIQEQISQAVKEAAAPIENIFKNVTGAIGKTTFPVFDLLSGIQSGALELASLPTAVSDSIVNNIDFSLSLLQNNNLADISRRTGAILAATVASSQGLVNSVEASASSIVNAITRSINEALVKVEAVLLDPIAALLQAILDAINGLPGKIIDVAFSKLLEEVPPEFKV